MSRNPSPSSAKPSSSGLSPLLLNLFGGSLQLRPQLVAYEAMEGPVVNQAIWTPLHAIMRSFQVPVLGSVEVRRQLQLGYYEHLKKYAEENGTGKAYARILGMVGASYGKLEEMSKTGKFISQHSQSMLPTFQSAGASILPSFSLALAHHAVQRAPDVLPSDASFLDRRKHDWSMVKGYTMAHNDAYKDLKIDRHFTPAWLTSFVIAGKGVTSLVPQSIYTPVSAMYGSLTGHLALTFNPAQDYDSSDFTKRTLLYTSMSYPFLRTAIPRLFVATAKMGSSRMRIISFASSLLGGGLYEFYCGYKEGTSYMRKPVEYITSIESEDGEE